MLPLLLLSVVALLSVTHADDVRKNAQTMPAISLVC
jgi:hypothetical protein